ncbi:MAG: cation:proton antiporter [Rhodospirillales bacterium]|nr:cation:proton antiporter [Rhodospirillales bacterium]MBO6786945.1 cation:proton antiporter [Rhodospirillales bacterium]
MVEILSLLGAAVIAVLISTRLGLGSQLGYLAAGAVIGPFGIGVITDAENLRHIGEFGVVFLLFMIGIEMKPQRLWIMRRHVFGLGGLQVLITGAVLSTGVHLAFDVRVDAALVIGFGLALSSTAFGVQLLSERNELTSHHGRNSFSVLLLQDLAVVPLIVLLPLLAVGEIAVTTSMGLAMVQAAGIIMVVVLAGRYAIGPAMHAIARIGNSDTFVAMALLLVLGFAWVMNQVGLSLALGAFMAGVLLAESEYRHQIEADILPFRGLLLGLFFMSVGMSLDPAPLVSHAAIVIGATVAMLVLKTAITIVLSLAFKSPMAVAIRTGFLLSQAGEFGFVLFSLAAGEGILPKSTLDILIAVVVLSMILTPAMVHLGGRVAERFAVVVPGEVHEHVAEETRPVLIAGFGRVGETVANMLAAAGVPYVAIDSDADCVRRARRHGHHVYFGSAGRPEVLRSVGAEHARLIVVTLDDPRVAEAMVRTVRRLYPHVPIHVRAHDWDVADTYTEMGVDHVMPETVEASLRLGAAALEAAGVDEERRRELFEDLSAENFAKMRGFRRS